MIDDELPPAKKYPPIDLNRFIDLAVPNLNQMPILLKLGFSETDFGYGNIYPDKNDKKYDYYRVVYKTAKREVMIKLFSLAGGYFTVTIIRPGGRASDSIYVGRYFELFDKESPDQYCLKLRTFSGALEEKIEQSIACINQILEERFEAVLRGDEWMDVPSSFYDYK